MSRSNRWRWRWHCRSLIAEAHMLFVSLNWWYTHSGRSVTRCEPKNTCITKWWTLHSKQNALGVGDTERNLCVGIRFSWSAISSPHTTHSPMAWQKIHTQRTHRIHGEADEWIDKNRRSSERGKRTTDTLAFTNEMLLVQMGFKP